MIIFSAAFGESHLRKLFMRCLPSLLTGAANDLGEPLRIALFTLKADTNIVERCIRQCAALRPYLKPGGLDIVAFDLREDVAPRQVATALLEQAVAYIVKRGEAWVHAVPDLVYSATALQEGVALHEITGKNIAIFNGRVNAANSSGRPFLDDDYLTAAADSLPAFFFENMSDAWREHRVETAGNVRGCDAGCLVVDAPATRFIFGTAPNPFVGRFEAEDIFAFREPFGFSAWDHQWKDTLANQGRLLVHTNLDAAMSIEPGTEKDMGKAIGQRAWSEALANRMRENGNSAIARRLKFSAPGMHCFTTATRSG